MAVDWTLVNTAVTEWARKYTYDLVGGLTATSRKALGAQLAAWIESGQPLPDLIGRLESVYGETRAKTIAVTEATRAYAEGNKVAWDESEVTAGYEWMTAQDELVCLICGDGKLGLAGKRVRKGEMFKSSLHPAGELAGPPAHVNCRCKLAPVLIGEKLTRKIRQGRQRVEWRGTGR